VTSFLNSSLRDVACVLPRWQVIQRGPEAWGIVRHCEHATVYPFLTACLFHLRLARITLSPAKLGLTLREHHCSTLRIADARRWCKNVDHKMLESAPMCLLAGWWVTLSSRRTTSMMPFCHRCSCWLSLRLRICDRNTDVCSHFLRISDAFYKPEKENGGKHQ
jgi:hypothetical protein